MKDPNSKKIAAMTYLEEINYIPNYPSIFNGMQFLKLIDNYLLDSKPASSNVVIFMGKLVSETSPSKTLSFKYMNWYKGIVNTT